MNGQNRPLIKPKRRLVSSYFHVDNAKNCRYLGVCQPSDIHIESAWSVLIVLIDWAEAVLNKAVSYFKAIVQPVNIFTCWLEPEKQPIITVFETLRSDVWLSFNTSPSSNHAFMARLQRPFNIIWKLSNFRPKKVTLFLYSHLQGGEGRKFAVVFRHQNYWWHVYSESNHVDFIMKISFKIWNLACYLWIIAQVSDFTQRLSP